MRKLSKLAIGLITAGVSSVALADIIIDNQTLPDAEISSYDISVINGNYTVTISTIDGWTLEPAGVDPGPDPDPDPDPGPDPDPDPDPGPVLVAVAASTLNPSVGDVVTFSWTTTDAESCVTAAGNSQWQNTAVSPVASGSAAITMTAVGTDVPYRIRCFGTDGTSTMIRGVLLNISEAEPNANPNCPNPQIARQGDVNDTWGELFDNGNNGGFPQAFDSEVQVNVQPGRYKQFSLETNNYVGAGLLTSVGLTDGIRRMSLSECPGIFSPEIIGDNCSKEQWTGTGLSQIVYWSTTGSPAQQGSTTFPTCQLDPNKTYYLNVTYSDFEEQADGSWEPEGSFCESSFCAHKIRTTLLD